MSLLISPRVSVIIPVYNMEQYLLECLESVCSQTYTDIEIIVVNDGSEDSSLLICNEFAGRDSRIKVIDKVNQGVVIARQTGVQSSTGEYLLFLDADDYLRKDCIQKIVDVLDLYNPDIVVYGSYTKSKDGSVIEHTMLYENGMYNKEEIINKIYPSLIQTDRCRYFSPSVIEKVFRKSLYLKNQLVNMNVMIGEDMACTVSCIYNARNMYIMWDCLYYYRYNQQSVTRSRKVYDWDCAKNISLHLSEKIDLSKYDLQMQLYRYVTHMLFITACSQFNGNASYKNVVKNIKKHINYPYYVLAINKSNFKKFSKGWFARLSLKYRIFWVLKLYQSWIK